MGRIFLVLRKYSDALVFSSVMLLLCLQRHAGFVLFFFLFIALAYWLVKCLYHWRDRQYRRQVAINVLILFLAALPVAIRHIYLAQVTRAAADRLVADVEQYRQTHGDYPASVEVLNDWSERKVKNELGMGGYHLMDGKPLLFYAATFIVFDVWDYNFETHRWEYRS